MQVKDFLSYHELTPDMLYTLFLYYTYESYDMVKIILLELGMRPAMLTMELAKRGYVDIKSATSHKNSHITEQGKQIIEELVSSEKIFIGESIISEDTESEDKNEFEKKFEQFWELFPSWDNSVLDYFPAERRLKTNRENCKRKYRNLLKEFPHEVIIEGLIREIEFRKEKSTGTKNEFHFMRASETWLNKRTFLDYLDLNEKDIEGNKTGFSSQI